MRPSCSIPADQAGEVKPCPGLPLLPLHLPPPVLPPQEGVDGDLVVAGGQVWGGVWWRWSGVGWVVVEVVRCGVKCGGGGES